jgi:hypothetical protein
MADCTTADAPRREFARALSKRETMSKASARLPGTKRVERGTLRGDLDGLAPCLLLARAGGGQRRWVRGGAVQGLFDFGQFTNDHGGVLVYSGLILPLTLCRDEQLGQGLQGFARLLQQRAGVTAPGEDRPRLPAEARSRRRVLQTWLDEAGLDCLRLVDKEPVRRWTRLTLTPKAFRSVLRTFDYVTAVEDAAGQPVRIIDHAAFGWSSHVELLDWCRLGSDEDAPIYPFGLYLATELESGYSDLFTGAYPRSRLVRPPEYWASFSTPNPDLVASRLVVRLDRDWVLHLTLGERTAEVALSLDINDPLPALLEWLQLLATGDLPIGIDIDEEGTEARIVAHPFGEGRLLVAVLDRWEETERATGVVHTHGFLTAFRFALWGFLRDETTWQYNADEWGRTAYRERLLQHPFLVGERRA